MKTKQDVVTHLTQRYAIWMKAIHDRDIDTVVSLYAEDAVYMAPGRPGHVGHAAIRQAWTGYFERPDFAARYSPSIQVADGLDMAYDTGSYVISLTQNDAKAEVIGKYVVIWKSVRDRWVVAVDIDNADHPA